MSSSIIIGDADALIALVLENDPHHKNAKKIAELLVQKQSILIFPVTVFPEAITSLKRAANQPEKAHMLNKKYLAGDFQTEYVDEEIMKMAAKIFDTKAVSKQNTLFDAIVAATAKKLEADAIFSFDDWYGKLGFKLAKDLD